MNQFVYLSTLMVHDRLLNEAVSLHTLALHREVLPRVGAPPPTAARIDHAVALLALQMTRCDVRGRGFAAGRPRLVGEQGFEQGVLVHAEPSGGGARGSGRLRRDCVCTLFDNGTSSRDRNPCEFTRGRITKALKIRENIKRPKKSLNASKQQNP